MTMIELCRLRGRFARPTDLCRTPVRPLSGPTVPISTGVETLWEFCFRAW